MTSWFTKKSSLDDLKTILNTTMPNSFIYKYLVKPLIQNVDLIIIGGATYYLTKTYGS
jgi:hypothetical protein